MATLNASAWLKRVTLLALHTNGTSRATTARSSQPNER
jgi:hypothetical protein